jgi:MoaA/NifB/PqqE/SkfB family radical SAM enzyme
MVAQARKLGYTNIQIQTNGRLFAYEQACRRFIAAGATEFSPALHGPNSEVHDFLTGAPGSFIQTVSGIRNLKRLKQRILTNTVITRPNYRQLPETARLLGELGVAQMQFAFVHIVGTAAKNRSWLVPRKELARPYILDALRVGRGQGVRVMTEAIPPCLLPGYEECASEWIMPATLVFDAEGVIDFANYRKKEGKCLGPACPKCRWSKQCEGPWKEYPEMFGWTEFKPVLR